MYLLYIYIYIYILYIYICSVSEQLGLGQFGTVHKGTWNTLRGPTEIAVKTLNGSASQDEEVKFLQEAAINGQFHHPNVIKLCGVVTVGHPVSSPRFMFLNINNNWYSYTCSP